MSGDIICPCCGSYSRCNCCRVQTTWGGFEEQRIANSLEKLIELLEKLLEEKEGVETPLATLDVMEHNGRHTERKDK